MEEKSDDDEITSYITGLNTVIARLVISYNTETLPITVISSQSKSILQTAKLKIVFQYLFDQLMQFKIFQNKFLWRYNDWNKCVFCFWFCDVWKSHTMLWLKLIDSLKTLEKDLNKL